MTDRVAHRHAGETAHRAVERRRALRECLELVQARGAAAVNGVVLWSACPSRRLADGEWRELEAAALGLEQLHDALCGPFGRRRPEPAVAPSCDRRSCEVRARARQNQ